MQLYFWCALSLALLVNHLAINSEKPDPDCGLFLFRTEYMMPCSGFSCAFEIRDECQQDFLIFEQNIIAGKYNKLKAPISKDQLDRFQELVEKMDSSEWNSIENFYLIGGLQIDYTYIDRKGELIRHNISWPPPSSEEAEKVKREFFLFKKFIALFEQEFGKNQLKKSRSYLDYYLNL